MPLVFPKIRGSSGERFLRIVLLAVVVLVVAWAFWANNERTIRILNERGMVSDTTGALTDEDAEFLRSFGKGLKEEFGLSFKFQAREDSLDIPDLDPKTFYLGIVPDKRQVAVSMPTLMRQALGPDFVDYLDGPHFNRYWASDKWVKAVKDGLILVWERLAAIEEGKAPPPPPRPDEGEAGSAPPAPAPDQPGVEAIPEARPAPEPLPDEKTPRPRGALNS